MNYRIYVPQFFENHIAFPWDILGYGVPKSGPVHSYVCTILAPLANGFERPFLKGHPTMSELKRMESYIHNHQDKIHVGDNENPFVSGQIFKFCENLYNRYPSDRKVVAQEVLDCLRHFAFYQEWVKERLTDLWKQNLITIPKEYLVLVKDKSDGDYSYAY